MVNKCVQGLATQTNDKACDKRSEKMKEFEVEPLTAEEYLDMWRRGISTTKRKNNG